MTAPLGGEALKAAVVAEGRSLGFALVGVTAPDPSEHLAFYRDWLARGQHGRMEYLARDDAVARRGELTHTFPEVRSVVVVADAHGALEDESAAADPGRAVIARYARGRDYHLTTAERLEVLLERVGPLVEGGVRGRVYVDTGPILERELASRAGLGWFGRNTMLIHPARGSYFLLGVLLLDVELPPDDPFVEDRCGRCTACLEACPTGALLGRDADGAPRIDARRCISYLTIELRGPIPVELREGVGNRVFGCDICQEVCPWNQRFAPVRDGPFTPADALDGPRLVPFTERLLAMSSKEYLRVWAESPLSRPRRAGMLRNLCVALGNWGSPEAVEVLARALSDRQPLVRAHAAWALGRIGGAEATDELRARALIEEDEGVRGEIRGALA